MKKIYSEIPYILVAIGYVAGVYYAASLYF